MAKSPRGSDRVAVSTRNVAPEGIPDLSAKVKKAIDAIKKPFNAFVKDFAGIAVKREELAPQFMKAFGLWQSEANRGTFVDFVRVLDAQVPVDREGYRRHRSYQAADYLRRLQGNAARRPSASTEAGGTTAAPRTPSDALTRVLASLVAIVPANQKDHIWEALKTGLNWDDRAVNRMKAAVDRTEPLMEIRGRDLQHLRITVPAREAAKEEEKAA